MSFPQVTPQETPSDQFLSSPPTATLAVKKNLGNNFKD